MTIEHEPNKLREAIEAACDWSGTRRAKAATAHAFALADDLTARLAAAEARCAELEEALLPFSGRKGIFDITLSDWNRAGEVLAACTPTGGEDAAESEGGKHHESA